MKTILLCSLLAASPAVLSHPGHGLPGAAHLHAVDYLLLVGVIFLVVNLIRRRK